MANFTLIEAEGLGQIVRKSQVILSSQTWTAPLRLAGNTIYVTGCAGGASGSVRDTTFTGFVIGGAGGSFVEKLPLVVTPGSAYTVTIPAGGAGGVTSGGNSGGDLTFGSLLTIRGGRASTLGSISNSASSLNTGLNIRGIQPPMVSFATNTQVFLPGQSVNGNICGETKDGIAANSGVGGGASGYFGNGTDSTSQNAVVVGISALANSGAGSGAVIGQAGSTSGAGGSGRLIIEWDELV